MAIAAVNMINKGKGKEPDDKAVVLHEKRPASREPSMLAIEDQAEIE